jgi:tetratricopeptide (TPR) repeat protein
MLAHHYQSALDLARATGQDTADLAPLARTALQTAGDRAFALNAAAAAAGYYRAALALWPNDAHRQRAELLRLLGTALYETAELNQAEAALAEGSRVAAAAGAVALDARIRLLLTEIRVSQRGTEDQALAECQAAAAVFEAEGDLEGLAEAWRLTGMLHFWLGHSPADREALERAVAYARQGGHRRVQMQASFWLGVTFMSLPVPADAAVRRTEQLLRTADGDPWAEADLLRPLSVFYAYTGRFADARDAIARTRSVDDSSGAKFRHAMDADVAGEIELLAGDPATAERYLREAYEAYIAMGDRGFRSTIAGKLAEALYALGRFDEAQQITEEAQAAATPDDIDAHARWRIARAKVLARRGEFPAARTLLDEATALLSPTAWAVLQAETLQAKAEVDRLAGAPERAEASLRAALRIYQDRHAAALVEQVAAALAGLTSHPTAKPA